PLTTVIGGTQVKVVAWYDNEWGYANRLVELAERVLTPVPVTGGTSVTEGVDHDSPRCRRCRTALARTAAANRSASVHRRCRRCRPGRTAGGGARGDRRRVRPVRRHPDAAGTAGVARRRRRSVPAHRR